ncbi:MAG: methylmalonyl Co-A mutase-associated GTPase MeaB [Flavobacteriaceae bacterium]
MAGPKKEIDPTWTQTLIRGIRNGETAALAQAITLVESTRPQHLEMANTIVEENLKNAGKSIRIGITGVPGVGKSTFIEVFGKLLTSKGKKVAVLAVDPSSTVSRGSILGDKTRMQELVKDAHAFIRPSPTGNSLGGVAKKTRETMVLCEAAGYNVILVETVGVGQSETAVHGMVDFFLLLKLAGAGDELQGIKRGIVEMADAVVISKADGDNQKRAKMAQQEFKRALHLYPPKSNGWVPKVLTCSALNGEGMDQIWDMIGGYLDTAVASDHFHQKRKEQNKYWLLNHLDELIKDHFHHNNEVSKALQRFLETVGNGKISPFKAAQKLMQLYHKSLKI